VRRLRDTQALLIKFSEENSRLSQDNQVLQAGRKALGVEHASVLDEIGELGSDVLGGGAMCCTRLRLMDMACLVGMSACLWA
jgi:hypothetical protein